MYRTLAAQYANRPRAQATIEFGCNRRYLPPHFYGIGWCSRPPCDRDTGMRKHVIGQIIIEYAVLIGSSIWI
jgi:hypothetical protein